MMSIISIIFSSTGQLYKLPLRLRAMHFASLISPSLSCLRHFAFLILPSSSCLPHPTSAILSLPAIITIQTAFTLPPDVLHQRCYLHSALISVIFFYTKPASSVSLIPPPFASIAAPFFHLCSLSTLPFSLSSCLAATSFLSAFIHSGLLIRPLTFILPSLLLPLSVPPLLSFFSPNIFCLLLFPHSFTCLTPSLPLSQIRLPFSLF